MQYLIPETASSNQGLVPLHHQLTKELKCIYLQNYSKRLSAVKKTHESLLTSHYKVNSAHLIMSPVDGKKKKFYATHEKEMHYFFTVLENLTFERSNLF